MHRRQEKPCRVCTATERTSYHFGAHTCMACASFFRRTVSFGIRFLCKANNACVVTPDIKFICRSCRYSNCIKAGMRREQVQQKKDKTKMPKYILESRQHGVQEIVRVSKEHETSKEGTSKSEEHNEHEFNKMLNAKHDDVLQYYVKQVGRAIATRKRFDVPEDQYQQFLISKRINDELAQEICETCPGTDLLEQADLNVLFRYCSFANLWMDSAWTTVVNPNDISGGDTAAATMSQFLEYENGHEKRQSDTTDASRLISNFNLHFQSKIGKELSRLQLDAFEYAALKSFCIWKLAYLDSTLTLKIVAQEQYCSVTSALRSYYIIEKDMDGSETAIRLADVTIILGSVSEVYHDTVKMYQSLGIEF
ncbi:Protein CBG01402 [Caenorhabditis briggsae]|uniref:Protein CBG01402 n=1 Tax=Caenorhabditis briggsae TaxID=6238 RepID=A8WQC0_CAEBR|nr:Protein CBG01402 [Caenorhabditis briggsae]CAP22678.2 Protein CBG01402 [Caenorhabditis briggsae]